MAWIESHTVLSRHRKLRELSISLRLRPAYVAGHLHLLWHAALEQQEDGNLATWSDQFIADQADFPGDAPQFVRLLQEKGWLDGKLIHDWLDYAGRYLDSKYRTSNPNRLKEIRQVHLKNKKGRLKTDYSRTQDAPPNQPNPTNQTDQSFDRFWSDYPPTGKERCAKKKVVEYWCRAKLGSRADEILQGLSRWLASDIWMKQGGQFVKNPLTWLRDEMFTQHPSPAQPTENDRGFVSKTPEELEAILPEGY